jgi:hypothetical protein
MPDNRPVDRSDLVIGSALISSGETSTTLALPAPRNGYLPTSEQSFRFSQKRSVASPVPQTRK